MSTSSSDSNEQGASHETIVCNSKAPVRKSLSRCASRICHLSYYASRIVTGPTSRRCRPGLVPVIRLIPNRSCAICPMRQTSIIANEGPVRTATRICPWHFTRHSVHCRYDHRYRWLGPSSHLYADDTHTRGSRNVGAADQFRLILWACLGEVATRMRANRLQLNPTKIEVLWCTTPCRQYLLPTSPIRVETSYASPSTSARNLGIFVDSDITMRTHVTWTVSACSAQLRQHPAFSF
jgi:hypothetical protein